MKENKYVKIVIRIFMIVLSSFVLAASVKLIVQPNNFLAGGVSGLTVLVSRYISIQMKNSALEATLYSVLYIVFNIPVFVFGFKKVGKQFVWYSLVNVLIFSAFVSLIPSSWVNLFQLNQIDLLTLALLAGLLTGVASVIAFVNEFSSGGTDIISIYLSRSKGKGIGSYSFIMNIFILLMGGIIFKNFVSLIYTVIYFFASSLVVNNLYIGHKKTMVEIITENPNELVDRLMQESNHGCTILSGVGAYSKNEKKILRIVVASNQIRRICDIVKEIDDKSFTTLIDIKQVNGDFYIPPMK